MAGPGTHLHRLIKRWTGEDYRAGCGCEITVRRMNRLGPARCRRRMRQIVSHLRKQASQRHWWKRLVRIPGTTMPIRWLVTLAIRRAEKDIQQTQGAGGPAE